MFAFDTLPVFSLCQWGGLLVSINDSKPSCKCVVETAVHRESLTKLYHAVLETKLKRGPGGNQRSTAGTMPSMILNS